MLILHETYDHWSVAVLTVTVHSSFLTTFDFLKNMLLSTLDSISIAEKCFDIWGILKMASVKSVESSNNCFSVNHIIRCRSKFLPLGFSKFVLILIL